MINKLTDKCKEDFKDWCFNTDGYEFDFNGYRSLLLNALIIEFFDSAGIYVQIDVENLDSTFSSYVFNKNNLFSSDENSNTRQEATNKAIITANKLYNETK